MIAIAVRASLIVLLSAGLGMLWAATPPQQSKEDQEAAAFRASMDAGKAGVDRDALPGAAIYRERCSFCHEGQAAKAPARTFLELMTPEAIHGALSAGIMKIQAAGLDDEQMRQVAEYLAGRAFGGPAPAALPSCQGAAARFDLRRPARIEGWGFTADNNHFIPAEVAGLAAKDVSRLKLKWAIAFPDSVRARSRPTFAYGALYVGSQDGTVYALDQKTGCVRWTFKSSAEVRTPVVIPRQPGRKPLAFFGDLIGRVYAVEALTGKEVWRIKADDHPNATITGSPVYRNGVLYVPVSSLEEASADPSYPCCTFRGSVLALRAATGDQLWKTYSIEQAPREVGERPSGVKVFAPSGAAIWNTPTLDAKRGLLYVGTANNYSRPTTDTSNSVMAMDLESGAVRWHWQIVKDDAWNVGCMIGNDSCPEDPGPDYDIGSGTMLARMANGRDRIIVGLKSGMAVAIDPQSHDRSIWATRVGRGSIQGGIQFGMAYDGKRIYVPIADMANAMDASSAARDAAAGPPRPGLYALNPENGEVLWSSPADNVCGERQFCDPGILASISAMPGVIFAGHMDGRVRAYDSTTGRVLWQFDTSVEMTTLSGAKARGGTIGGGGPVVFDGMLYTNSGYGLYFHLPGNVLAAFSVDGK
ncbi:MAG: PQQ-binding-like beta-propeller repeat protein [Steroidobacteraceae bacterium]